MASPVSNVILSVITGLGGLWPPSLRQIWIWLWGEGGSYWRVMRGGGPGRQNYGYDGWWLCRGRAGLGCSAQLCSGLTEVLYYGPSWAVCRCAGLSPRLWPPRLVTRSLAWSHQSLSLHYSYDMRSMCRTVVHTDTQLCTHRAIWQLRAALQAVVIIDSTQTWLRWSGCDGQDICTSSLKHHLWKFLDQ